MNATKWTIEISTRQMGDNEKMLRILLKKRLDDKSFQEKRRITLSEVSDDTGISRATLTRIANVPGYNTNTDTLDALCKYFECGPSELLVFVSDDENKDPDSDEQGSN